jgi:hypothetical protein
MKPDITVCLKSWSDELSARANRVRELIGGRHWLSDGHHKEYVLRELLRRYLPRHLVASRGFIKPPDRQVPPSREIDIMLSDFSLHPPWFNEGGLVVAPPAAVVGQIQVKTLLGYKEFSDVLDATVSGNVAMEDYIDPGKVWGGGLFFKVSAGESVTQCCKNIDGWIRKFVERSEKQLRSTDFPNCVAALDGPVVFFARSPGRASALCVKAFDCATLAPAVMLADLFEHLRALSGDQTRRGALSNVLEGSGLLRVYTEKIPL